MEHNIPAGAILTKDAIIAEIEAGNIKISEPFSLKNVGPASVDLTLDNKFRIYKNSPKPIDISAEANYRDESITELITVDENEGYILPPFTSCLGITKEKVELSPSICGLLEGRSRFARLGLLVHFTASLMSPGIKNKQVLEICNLSPRPLRLIPGVKVCQFIFVRAEGECTYNGRYADQEL